LYKKYNDLYHWYIEQLDEEDYRALDNIDSTSIETYYAYLTPRLSKKILSGEINISEANWYLNALYDIKKLSNKAKLRNKNK